MNMKQHNNFRPTAYPLMTADPYFSIWSFTDRLTDDTTRHWTGRRNGLCGCIRVDNTWYRFLGRIFSDDYRYYNAPKALPQISVKVEATATEYIFANELIRLKLTFFTPLLMDDLAVMSRTVSYVSIDVSYLDNQEHDTEIYFDLCSETCKDDLKSKVFFGVDEQSAYAGRGECGVLESQGDDRLADWGYYHLAFPGASYGIFTDEQKRDKFVYQKPLSDIEEFPLSTAEIRYLSAVKAYGKKSSISDFLCVGFEDICSLQYFGKKLKPYWALGGDSFSAMFSKAVSEYEILREKCEIFNEELRMQAERISTQYADLLCLAYRQVIAAHKIAESDGKLLFCSKECFSGGYIGTVDVTYPSIPMFLLYCPDLVEGMLNPVFEYAEGDYGWKYDFAPHDVGMYPNVTGQEYRWDKEDESYCEQMSHMPVEECGNMLLCTAALCKVRGDFSYAKAHFDTLKQWADYLMKAGFDPENQLCTDDFAGHLAHNCNLSVKAILGIAAFSYLANQLGEDGSSYLDTAKKFAAEWKKAAFDGDHYRLAFDRENTWSIKYNLVWDRFFGFDVFDKDIMKTETEFYKTKCNPYGLPLDCRADYGKTDWQIWTGCLAEDKTLLCDIAARMHRFVSESEQRVPFTDWHMTSEPDWIMFQNRTVQGGLFMPLLFD